VGNFFPQNNLSFSHYFKIVGEIGSGEMEYERNGQPQKFSPYLIYSSDLFP
jgi:hypothetical protein